MPAAPSKFFTDLEEADEDVRTPLSPLEKMENPGSDAPEIDLPETEDSSFSIRSLLAFMGPGFLMSIAYLDPGNLESDLQAGAFAGYQLLWVLLWSHGIGLLFQVMSARLGVVTGDSLASHCRKRFPRHISLPLWVMIEIAIIASDIQEVVGSGIAIRILSNGKIPIWAGCLITGADTFSFLGLHAFGVRKLEAFFAIVIGIMVVCMGANFIAGAPAGLAILKGVALPLVSDDAIQQAAGVLGAVIMPHNLYLHSALVHSRKINRRSAAAVRQANLYNAIESSLALFISFIINAMVLAVFAEKFYRPECQAFCSTDTGCQGWIEAHDGVPGQCSEIGLSIAGDALGAVLGGDKAKYIWAVGVLASGQASTMTGTYAGQFVMEGFLRLNIKPWQRVLFTRSLALVPAILVALATQRSTGAADDLDEWLNVLQSIMLPFAVFPLLKFTSSKQIMGSFKSNRILMTITWGLAIIILGINAFLVYLSMSTNLPNEIWVYILVLLFGIVYISFVLRLILDELKLIFSFLKSKKEEELSPDEIEVLLVTDGPIN